jgi:nitrite transporter NirC
MTLFSIALLGKHPESVSLLGMGYNLLWVTLGNLLSGGLFMALGYWLYSGVRMSPGGEDTDIEEEA